METNTNNNPTICDIIANYMSNKTDAVATLKEIYSAVKVQWNNIKDRKCPAEETIRAAIYKSPEKYSFKRIGKGLYFLEGEKTSSLLIHGDSRELSEIDNNSIDCIITDHPWSDKKAHKSGNQKDFSDYETFEYTFEDFQNKARVLKDGSYLVEFLPVESSSNWEYLAKIKEMATQAGFKYYCQTIWRKAPEGAINTGRTTKGVEQIIIFSKGKPRRLAPTGKPYMTTNMLSYEIDIPANKGKDKHHQAEKPLLLYKYLISNLTLEGDVCLDQFGGACNLLEAAVDTNRWGIVYEKFIGFVKNAVDRFSLFSIYKPEDTSTQDVESTGIVEQEEVISIKNISSETTDFQFNHLKKCSELRKELFSNEQLELFNKILQASDIYTCAFDIDILFNDINQKGFANKYNYSLFDVDLENYTLLIPLYEKVEEIYQSFDPSLRSYYLNVKLELNMFMEYAVICEKRKEYSNIVNDTELIERYFSYLSTKKINNTMAKRIINQYTNHLDKIAI